MNYKNAINILTSQGRFHIKLGLERISAVLNLLGNPQDDLNFIHVAGTNGKGSVCAMLSSILIKAGYNTGLYTSPHLIDYVERIKLNGLDISKKDFSAIFEVVYNVAQKNDIHLTEFEILTAMAFVYFKKKNVDIVVLETGLGGRLDATNVIKKNIVSIITSIDIDHSDRLGNTIEEIACEKSGIIKNKCPVVINEGNKGFRIINKLASNNIAIAENNYKIIDIYNNIFSNGEKDYQLSLLGTWQQENLSLVIKAIEILKENNFNVTEESIKFGLSNTIWPSRMQFLRDKSIIIDGAHNLASAQKLRESLDLYFSDNSRVWLFGALKNKDYSSVIENLFKDGDIVILTDSFSPSSASIKSLSDQILKMYANVKIYKKPNTINAVDKLLSYCNANKTLVIAGSLYLTGGALAVLENKK